MSERTTYKLGEVTVNFDSRRVPVKAADRKPGKFPYYGASGVVDHVDEYLFDGEYLLVAEDGENLRTRKTSIAFMASGKFWVNNHAHIVQGNHLANTHYLCYALTNADIAGFLSGSTQPKLTQAALNSVQLQLPSRKHQDAVIDVLGALDDKIAANGRIVGQAYDLMRCHYESAIVDGTAATTIGSIADVFDGPHATPKKTDSGPWFLSISSLNRGRLVLEESAHLSEQDFDQWTRRVMPRLGDVLFSYETRLGEAALMPAGVRACLGRRMGLLRSREGQVGSRTLLQAFLSESFQVTIRQRAVHGATVDRIPLTELPSWPITLPARDVERLEHVLGGLDELASYKDRENEVLASLRGTLLPKLMSGEIRVRDAEKAVEDAT